MKRVFSFAIAFLFLVSGCGFQQVEEDGNAIYYRTTNKESKTALEGVCREADWSDYVSIFTLLKEDIPDRGLVSLIPDEASLRSFYMEKGVLYLDISPEYSALSGIQLTMANSCITLTYCQLPEVASVCITSDGELMGQIQSLSTESFMLDGGRGDTSEISVDLFYPDRQGGIGYFTDRISVMENLSAPETILHTLTSPPEHKELQVFLPSDGSDLSLWTEDGICYINLTTDWVTELETGEIPLETKLRCITNSVCGLSGITAVQFLLDGAVLGCWDHVGGDFPMKEALEGCVRIDTEE